MEGRGGVWCGQESQTVGLPLRWEHLRLHCLTLSLWVLAQDDGIVYASLALSSSTSPRAPPSHRPLKSPQNETLYSVLKA